MLPQTCPGRRVLKVESLTPSAPRRASGVNKATGFPIPQLLTDKSDTSLSAQVAQCLRVSRPLTGSLTSRLGCSNLAETLNPKPSSSQLAWAFGAMSVGPLNSARPRRSLMSMHEDTRSTGPRKLALYRPHQALPPNSDCTWAFLATASRPLNSTRPSAPSFSPQMTSVGTLIGYVGLAVLHRKRV